MCTILYREDEESENDDQSASTVKGTDSLREIFKEAKDTENKEEEKTKDILRTRKNPRARQRIRTRKEDEENKESEKSKQSSAEKNDEKSEKEPKSVNYAYHPIIDFFDRYRWSAS